MEELRAEGVLQQTDLPPPTHLALAVSLCLLPTEFSDLVLAAVTGFSMSAAAHKSLWPLFHQVSYHFNHTKAYFSRESILPFHFLTQGLEPTRDTGEMRDATWAGIMGSPQHP